MEPCPDELRIHRRRALGHQTGRSGATGSTGATGPSAPNGALWFVNTTSSDEDTQADVLQPGRRTSLGQSIPNGTPSGFIGATGFGGIETQISVGLPSNPRTVSITTTAVVYSENCHHVVQGFIGQ